MSLWRQLTRGLRTLTNRTSADRDVADEVQHYLEQAELAHAAAGLTDDEARRAARVELGSVASVTEQVRSSGWEHVVESVVADARYAATRLRGEPGFAAATIFTIALGIGAITAIFSAIKPILLDPLPYPRASRIATLIEINAKGTPTDGTFGMYHQLSGRLSSLDSMAVFKPWRPTMTGPDQPERFEGQRVSFEYFRVLGVLPAIGRSFESSEDRQNGPNVVILSDRLWHRRFAGDPAIVGQQITLDGNAYLVAGIMPSSFENVLSPSAELWAPLQYDMAQGRAWGHHLRTIVRVRPEVTMAAAAREIDVSAHRVLDEHHPVTYGSHVSFAVESLQDNITGGVRASLLAILGAAIVVLIIVCVNVTMLLLARLEQRRAEFALRAALGAGSGRLIRQLITESLFLAVLGGAAGLAVAALAVKTLLLLSPPGLPRAGAIEFDRPIFLFGFVTTTLIGLAIGLLPAMRAARTDPHQDLKADSRRAPGGHRRARGVLVVAQVALALVLLVSAGLLLRSLRTLFSVDAGFDVSHLLTMQIQTSGRRFDDPAAVYQFFDRALEAVRQVPGVADAGLTSQLPLSGDLDIYGVGFDPKPTGDPGEDRGTFRYAVSPGYIETMRIPLRRGRVLDAHDAVDAPRAALISESMARTRLPGLDPIGRRLTIGNSQPYTIVGVVGDVRQVSLAVNQPAAVYVTATQWKFADDTMSLVVRARGDSTSLAPAIRQAIWSVDKDQPIVRIATVDELLDGLASERRFALTIFEAFALVALILAAAGIYGVLAGSVAERRHEIGVRAALGATHGNILGLVLRQGLGLTAAGAALGLAGAAAASRTIGTMLFGVSRFDPLTYASMIGVLAIVAILASGLPAWRALRVDPATALRAE